MGQLYAFPEGQHDAGSRKWPYAEGRRVERVERLADRERLERRPLELHSI